MLISENRWVFCLFILLYSDFLCYINTLTYFDIIDLYIFNYYFLLIITDGGPPKYRPNSQYNPSNGIVNPNLQTSVDHLSTLSRPRSTDASTHNSVHGRQLNGALSRGPNGLHEDLDFPPTPRTLTRKKNIVWMRPHVSLFSIFLVFLYDFFYLLYFTISILIHFHCLHSQSHTSHQAIVF